MKKTFKTLTIAMPEGWSDDSIMIFSSPELAPLRMLHAKMPPATRRSVVLKSQPLGEATRDLAQIARGQEEMMQQLTQQCVVQSRSALEIAGAPAIVLDYLFMAEAMTQQIQAYFILDGHFHTLCATAPAGNSKQLGEDFMSVVKSLMPAPAMP